MRRQEPSLNFWISFGTSTLRRATLKPTARHGFINRAGGAHRRIDTREV
jgi:hypothetical protein